LNIDGCIEEPFPKTGPLFDCLVVGRKDTVSVHRGLSVVLLSNADTSGYAASLLRAEIAESIGRFARRANCRRLTRTERRAANNLRRAARVQGDAQFLVKNAALKGGQFLGRYRQILAGF
jgi:hypothetical protein